MWGIDEKWRIEIFPFLTSNELSMIKFFHCFKCILFVLLIALLVVKGRWRNLFVIITKPDTLFLYACYNTK